VLIDRIASMPTMLVAEPDEAMAADLLRVAALHGIATEWCRDGAATLAAFSALPPDVLIIAAQIPTLPVATVVHILRWRWNLRILVGSSAGDDGRAQRALAAGATAIVARPYQPDAIFSLGFGATNGAVQPPEVLVAGPITVDQHRHEVRVDGREVHLTQRELGLLSYLMGLRGRVATHDDIINSVWGHPIDPNNVAVHVKRLRDKLGDRPQHGQLIRTVRGVGYQLVAPFDVAAASTAS
jgi:DNA-binding response OmpR family regulator